MIDLLSSAFFQNALLASLLGGAGLSMAGVLVTQLNIPFLGVTLSHAAFLGAVAGLLTGQNPLLFAMVACVLASTVLGPIADRSGTTSNAVLSIFFTAAMGLALLLLAFIPGPRTEALNLIWGSVLTISRGEVCVLAVVVAAGSSLILVYQKELSAIVYHREIAASSGVPQRLFYYGILVGTGIMISASLSIVGGLLVFALLVNPASAASQLTRRLTTMLALAALFGVLSCLTGLAVSYVFDVPTGAVIALASCGIFAIAFLLGPRGTAATPSH